MTQATLQAWATRVLVGFVLLTIGFALGRGVTERRLRNAGPPPPAAAAQPGQSPVRLRAYYLHGPVRCVTCNGIERTARQLLEREFAADLAAGRVVWRAANFELEPDLARRYNVAASSLVLVSEAEGRETGFRRLDEVWTLADKPVELEDYIRRNVQELLP